MKTQRSLPPHQKKKKIIFLQNQGKTQRWRGKQIHNELKTVLTTVDFLQKAGGYLRQPRPHTWGPPTWGPQPAVPTLKYYPQSQFFFFPTVQRSALSSDSLSWSLLVSNLFSIRLAFWKHIPPPSILRLDLWVVPTTLSHCPSHCITSGLWKTPSSPLASVSPLLSFPPCSLCLLQLRFYPFRPYHLRRCSEGRGWFVILSPPFTPS